MSVDELLTPVSAEQPCGEDIAYDPAFQELDAALQGKPETQFSAAEEPNWKEIEVKATELFKRSKNLRVAIALMLALLQREALSGFRDGMSLLRGLIEQYWADLYPKLDPEDNNDPTERINILSSLVIPMGTFGDPVRFLERLRRAPFTHSARLGRFGLADVDAAHSGTPPEGAPTTAQIDAALKDTPAEDLLKIFQAVTESRDETKRIDQILTETIGASRSLDWTPQLAVLNEIDKILVPHLPSEAVAEAAGVVEEGATVEGSKAVSTGGQVSSRQDVVRLLDRICDYYKQSEPSSPVPFLLRRARALVDMDYMQILENLTPDALAQAQVITGQSPPAETSGDQ
jgi:type VI secretion system protein ImpA